MERLKDVIEKIHDKPIKESVQPIEYLDYLASEQKAEGEVNEDELDAVFIEDEEDEWALKNMQW